MRLKTIKLAGFKSFVDPTTVPTPSNLVCVVGPNGCGKSNTIDAVRWVMGESSAKNLRGASMSDVIFNGSSTRKPVGQASVELVFDNSDGRLGGAYAQYAEISIKRQVSRDGQSNYYLNGSRCRRRDITDIFLGTGLGPRSYAIIEQGTISRMIEAKPEELRVFIEEAAGISKYKERRRETENRMRHTRENLERIDDLCGELEKRLATLQRQARTAEKYKCLKQEEREAKAQLLALRYRSLSAQVLERDRAIETQQTTLESHLAELTGVDAATEAHRQLQIEVNEQFNEIQGNFYALGAEIARLEQSIQHIQESRAQQARELAEVERAWEEATEHMQCDREAIETLKLEIEMQDEQWQLSRDAELESVAVLGQAEANMQRWQSEWDGFNGEASEQIRSAEVERARIHHLEQSLDQLRRRSQRINDELAALSLGDLDEEIKQLSHQRETLEEQLTQLRHQLAQQREDITEERELGQTLNDELDAERSRLQSLQGRCASLEALQQQALGKNQNDINEWLQRQGLDDASRLAQNLTVVADWAHAVETVLGSYLEAVCVEDMGLLSETLEELSQGNLALIEVDAKLPAIDHNPDVAAPLLLSKVKAKQSLTSLLGGIYVAESVEQAVALRGQLKMHESIITSDGLWFGPDWLRVSHGIDEKAGVLAREQTLKSVVAEIALSEQRVETLQQRLDEGRSRLHDLEQGREELQSTLNQTTQVLARTESQLNTRQERVQQHYTRKQRLESDIDELHQQRDRDEAMMAEARARLEEALLLTEGHEQRRGELQQQREELRAQLEASRQRARADREAAHEYALRLQSARAQLEGTQKRLERMESQIQHLSRRRDELREVLQHSADPVAEMAVQLETLLQQRLDLEDALSQARRSVEEADHTMRQLTEQRHQIERKTQEIRSGLEKLRLGGQEYKVRCQTVSEQFLETGFNMDELFAQLPQEATEDSWQKRVNEIGQQIQRLGAINLAAIDEYREQSERKEYLDTQQQDLNNALTTLENAIRKIDRETRTRFKDTYDKVNDGVKELFPRLFGGGHAYLDMTGDDLLDTGVTIMARPPGKRNSSIHLLSGGEKALTAVALVFAIFQLNPAPFCMLDEVDAPLDEANVGRFCEMVKAMSESVQFIFITHNKATMEMGEHLAGVTMHEPGVSRLVAVDIEEATQMVG